MLMLGDCGDRGGNSGPESDQLPHRNTTAMERVPTPHQRASLALGAGRQPDCGASLELAAHQYIPAQQGPHRQPKNQSS